MGRTLRIETNDPVILNYVNRLFERYRGTRSAKAEFLWRIVSDAPNTLTPSWPTMTAFSDTGLRYVNLGQRSFFAVDLDSREAVAFLSRGLAHDAVGFPSVFVATLFDMTAAALGLTLIPAACVSSNGRALLIFGPPRSGKTTSVCWARRSGLEFCADQASYLDLEGGRLCAWGQFWPAAFRPETMDFLPELATSTDSFAYGPLKFLCLREDSVGRPYLHSLPPVACVFLERNAPGSPRLIRLPASEWISWVRETLLFADDRRFWAQRDAALEALGNLPAFSLRYGADPAEAAGWYRKLFTSGEKACEIC